MSNIENFDNVEKKGIDVNSVEFKTKLDDFNKAFDTKLTADDVLESIENASFDLEKKMESVDWSVKITSSIVENLVDYFSEDGLSLEAMKSNIERAAAELAIEKGTEFAAKELFKVLPQSAMEVIEKVGKFCLVGEAAIAFSQILPNVFELLKGEIDKEVFLKRCEEIVLGTAKDAVIEKGAEIGMKTGAKIGATAGPVGAVTGAAVGATVGCVTTAVACAAVMETGGKGAEVLAQKAQNLYAEVIDTVTDAIPEAVGDVIVAFADFAASIKLPFSF